MSKVYILCGLPYSGKTTLRNMILKSYPFKVISIDEIMDERNMWREGHPTQEDWNEAYSEAFDRLKTYIDEDDNILFDGGCLKLSERQAIKSISEENGANCYLIYINTPKEEIMMRKLRNEKTQERGQLDDVSMQNALNMFEEPIKAENPIIYSANINIQEWITKNIK